MTTVTSRRIDAVRAFGQFVASERGRSLLRSNGYSSDTPVIAADEDDSVTSVMARVRSAGSAPVLVAVHYPSRTRSLEIVELAPSHEKGADHVEARGASTIGMLVDALAKAAKGSTFSVSSNVVASRFDLAYAA